MRKMTLFLSLVFCALASAAFAEGNNAEYISATIVAAATALGIAAAGGSIGQGIATSKAMEGISRQPEATNSIRGSLILGLALIESLTIYALVVALILIFLNPIS